MRVLVTDAELTISLAAIRSLVRAGYEVVAASPRERAHGFRSRYVVARVLSPPPTEDESFVDFVAAQPVDAVLPLDQVSTAALARHRDRVGGRLGLAVPPWKAMEVALSKARTLELAAQLGIGVPATYGGAGDVESFPVVAKPNVGSGALRYANSASDLEGLDEDWLIQEYVPGEGRGVFALFQDGRERAVFMHRRLREFPVTGGASTAAESIYDPELRELGLRLLSALSWHGLAMVEFKRDRRDGTYKLMEVNPKLWGSLALAIAAGVDFPRLAVELALGRPVVGTPYRVGARFQWMFRDLLHAAARPRDLPRWLADVVDPRVQTDVSLRDPLPHLAEARATAVDVFRRMRTGTLRRPHGAPADVPDRQ